MKELSDAEREQLFATQQLLEDLRQQNDMPLPMKRTARDAQIKLAQIMEAYEQYHD